MKGCEVVRNCCYIHHCCLQEINPCAYFESNEILLKKPLASRRVATHSLQRPTDGGALISTSEANKALVNTNTEAFIPAFLPVSTEARGSSSLSV